LRKGVACGQWQALHLSNEKEFDKVKKNKIFSSSMVTTSGEKKDAVMKDDESVVHDDNDEDDGNDGDVAIVDGNEAFDIQRPPMREKGATDKKKRPSPLFKLKKTRVTNYQQL